MMGARFSTLVRDGASPAEILNQVARQNNGGVARLYYPEMNAYEIVAVKIGDRLLVKGDPEKVAKADFSKFADSATMKKMAVKAASESSGGLHLFLGEDGIPIVQGKNGELYFPNGDELMLHGESGELHIRPVDNKEDPKSLQELVGGKGLSVSEKASEFINPATDNDKIARSHGGVRSEKLMLPSTQVALFRADSGQITTIAESAARDEGFPAPQFIAPALAVQNPSASGIQFINAGLALPSERGPILLPMDGSAARVPYLFVKIFDGRLEDCIRVRGPSPLTTAKYLETQHPLATLHAVKERKLGFVEIAKPSAITERRQAPSANPLQVPAPKQEKDERRPAAPPIRKSEAGPKTVSPAFPVSFSQKPSFPEAKKYIPSLPLQKPMAIPRPDAFPALREPAAGPQSVKQSPKPQKKAKPKSIPKPAEAKPSKKQKTPSKKPKNVWKGCERKTEQKKRERKSRQRDELRLPKSELRKRKSKAREFGFAPKNESIVSRSRDPRKHDRKRDGVIPSPAQNPQSVPGKASPRPKKLQKRNPKPLQMPHENRKAAVPAGRARKGRKKKGTEPYFMNELLGLYRKSRGRKFRMNRKRAP